MAEFKRQEAKDREEFGHSDEAKEWLRRLRDSHPNEYKIALVPNFPNLVMHKLIVLPW